MNFSIKESLQLSLILILASEAHRWLENDSWVGALMFVLQLFAASIAVNLFYEPKANKKQ